ncbi:hypothetical protein HYS48_00565 [Candidatus Woesearchaeota archaeon]|nr:hypothetical protein [Candidatus Woesearchaeota archaeon]
MKREVRFAILFSILLIAFFPALAHEEEEGGEKDNHHALVDEKLEQARNISFITGIVGAIIIFAWQFLSKKKKSSKEKIKGSIIWVVSLAVVLVLAYSVYYVKITGAEKEGLIVCEGEQCFWAAHIHAEMEVTVCGENIRFEKEEGNLGEAHTHKEEALIHWHDKVPIDPNTKEILDKKPLMLGAFFEQMEYPFDHGCIGEYCNGDACPEGNIGTLQMWVNGIENDEFEQFVWKDGDQIKIIFG